MTRVVFMPPPLFVILNRAFTSSKSSFGIQCAGVHNFAPAGENKLGLGATCIILFLEIQPILYQYFALRGSMLSIVPYKYISIPLEFSLNCLSFINLHPYVSFFFNSSINNRIEFMCRIEFSFHIYSMAIKKNITFISMSKQISI